MGRGPQGRMGNGVRSAAGSKSNVIGVISLLFFVHFYVSCLIFMTEVFIIKFTIIRSSFVVGLEDVINKNTCSEFPNSKSEK